MNVIHEERLMQEIKKAMINFVIDARKREMMMPKGKKKKRKKTY